jgi:3,4-dihydroxy 2-butanone 4-phosphate synthase/GTP cyclohydrolase II
MARLPDLQRFAHEHQLHIGTIADLIQYRSKNESLLQKVSSKTLCTAHGEFIAHAYQDVLTKGVHLALVKGQWSQHEEVLARVHEPLSIMDLLEPNRKMHSWGLDESLKIISQEGAGVLVLLNAGENAQQLLSQFQGTAKSLHAPERGRMDLRSYGIGAQILKDCGVEKMRLLGHPRRMPSMTGYGLEIVGYRSKTDGTM